MKVNSPYKNLSVQELELGILVVLPLDGQPALAITASWPGGQLVFVVLEGPRAGAMLPRHAYDVTVVTDPIVVELPRGSRASLSLKMPEKPLFVAINGTETFFVILVNGEYFMVNIETGVIGGLQSSSFYLTEWELWPEDAKKREPILTSK